MIPFIGLASGLGGSHSGSGEGPISLQKKLPTAVEWKAMFVSKLENNDKRDHIASLNLALAQETYSCAKDQPFQVIIGGDHSCAIGTWSGIAEAYRLKGEDLALLWIDAHMDSHTPESSPSGNIHGMPLATLLGFGSPQFTEILSPYPKLKAENVFLIGIRSYEEAEKELLERLNVRVYYMDEVRQRGIKAVFAEIIELLQKKNMPYGVTLDIDFFDPRFMSATGTPEPGGADPAEFIESYEVFDSYPPVAFEYVEFNPPQDTENNSLEFSLQILQRVLGNKIPSLV